MRLRRAVLRTVTGLALLGATLVAAPAPAATAGKTARADVDPALVSQLAQGPATAIFAWDDRAASREDVRAFLEARGTDAHLFPGISAGYACAGGMAELRTLASMPGGLSVVANEELETATDRTVPTAFNGNPANVWANPPTGLGITGRGVAIAVVDTGLDSTHPDIGGLETAENPGGRVKANTRVLYGHQETGREICPPAIDVYTDEPNSGTYLGSSADTERLSGHGTYIAGVAAGGGVQNPAHKGMAPGADLVGVAVSDAVNVTLGDPAQQGYKPTTLGVVAGLSYVYTKAVLADGQNPSDRAINVRVVLAGWVQPGTFESTHPISLALSNLYANNIPVVLPAGNLGPNASDCSKPETCRFNAWAGWQEFDDHQGNHYVERYAIGVAASIGTSRRTLAPFSSRGAPSPHPRLNGETLYWQYHRPTITAPGTAVTAARRIGLSGIAGIDGTVGASPEKGNPLHTDRYYQTMSGTSAAAAHVAGAVALMQEAAYRAKGCYLTSDQVRIVLEQTATPMPGYGPWEVGSGMLDATAAVHYARSIPRAFVDDVLCPPAG